MILYFSGTGNSLYIAKRIAAVLNDKIVSIPELVRTNQYQLTLQKDETVGFVYPVNGFAPPNMVTDYLKKVTFNGYQNNYMYSVFNCAGAPEYTSRVIKEASERAGYPIQGFYQILMPGNDITKKKHLPKEKVTSYLDQCDQKVDQIVCQIKKRANNYKKEKHSYFLSYFVHKLTVLQKTEKFIFGEECVGCGKCANICPTKAITIKDGRPVRNQKDCAFCLGCVNVCPTHALQIGKMTQGHPQYINPHYNGKARDEA